MARIRQIKPDILVDDQLAKISRDGRLLFIYSWMIADREGRLEDRPAKIKAQLFPFDDDLSYQKIDALLTYLHNANFIIRYEINSHKYIQIRTFPRHQLIGRDEPASEIASAEGMISEYDPPPNSTVRARIYQRDSYTCVYCGRNMASDIRSRCVDHVIPYSQRGTNREKNLVTACKKCNAAKGGRTPDEAEMNWPKGYGETYEDLPINTPLTDGQHPVMHRQHPPDMKGIREGELEVGKGSKEKETDNASSDKKSLSAPASPVFIQIPLVTGENYPICQCQVDEWKGLYPAVDIEQELRNYLGWTVAHPQKRKTKRGILGSINFWLSDKQNKGGSNNGGGRNLFSNKEKQDAEYWDRKLKEAQEEDRRDGKS